MLAVDTNILVYANRRDSRWHKPARQLVEQLSDDGESWAIPWPCVTEFVAVMTRGDRDGVHMSLATATAAIDDLIEYGGAIVLFDTSGCWRSVKQLLKTTNRSGSSIYDLRIAAVCIEHDVRELLTVDSAFSTISSLRCTNPFS